MKRIYILLAAMLCWQAAQAQFELSVGLDAYQRVKSESYSTAYGHAAPSLGAAYTFALGKGYGIQVGLAGQRRVAETFIAGLPARVSETYLTVPVMLTSEDLLARDGRTRMVVGLGAFVSMAMSQKTFFPETMTAPAAPGVKIGQAGAFAYGKVGPCAKIGIAHAVSEHVDIVANMHAYIEFERSTLWGKSFQNFAYNSIGYSVGVAMRLGKAKKIEAVD